MWREFAIEPQALGNWQDFRYLCAHLGIEHGRLIAEFPSKWKRLVYQACEKYRGHITMAKIEETLRRLDRALVRLGRSYDPVLSWLENAERQQTGTAPFHAIVATGNPRSHASVMMVGEIEAAAPLWSIPRERAIPREPAALARCIAPLLRLSREILIIDPFFDPNVPRFRPVLRELLFHLRGLPIGRLELHASNKKSGTSDFWKGACGNYLRPLIPTGLNLKVVRWAQRPGGERLHPRYVLTELGGIRIDVGLDEGEPGETTDIAILDAALYARRWSDFHDRDAHGNPKPYAFDLFDELLISGTAT